ncbi:hypothetical protein A3A79_00660 [Candidatus Gottesmanbacteria bacterium RIFCSPLOWO2_01_FULL_43_11b]|uniref:RCK N-terminal domain-containing protein n=1 Tax=Candidatus Gottesmanbacteria bacterium RIFCSPLOWO2_01_FULL_43_11b TaxID=1798392 RepID=A0A1F6AGA5_9BACT|nr:MAG: hypothetical protein A3A79_00660 [Candidatus Gottesmanbacteria bacterium RIFCSPLOWO2_01_FULL_43_11b]
MNSSLSLITTLLLILSAAIGGGVIAKRLKLPILLGYIAGGVFVGNILPGVLNRSMLEVLADGGVTLLLFTLGVEFSFQRLRKIMGTIAWAATFQIVMTLLVFLLVFFAFGLGFLPSLIFAMAASLSSTAVVIKVLSDKGQLDTLPGEIATGWLVIQDLAVVPMLLLLPSIASGQLATSSFGSLIASILVSLLKATVLLLLIIALGKRGVPRLMNAVSTMRSRELFLLVVVGLVFFAALVSFSIGLSPAVGAFLAGLLVAETSQNHAVFSEIRPLRDLFSVVFFVTLGMVLPVTKLFAFWPMLLSVTFFAIFFKWFVVMGLGRFIGYHRITAFSMGVMLTSMSEFGFILGKESLGLKMITNDQYSLLVAIVFLSIFLSTPLMTSIPALYGGFRKTLGKFPKIFPEKEETFIGREGLPVSDHVVLCGYGRVGRYIGRALEMAKIPYLVVDYNSATIKELRQKGVMTVYGDPADRETLDYAQVDKARAVVIAIPDRHTQELVITNAKSLNRRIRIICRTHHEEDQRHLKSLGVHTIVQPEFEAAISIVGKLLTDFGVPGEDIAGKVTRLKIEHGLG